MRSNLFTKANCNSWFMVIISLRKFYDLIQIEWSRKSKGKMVSLASLWEPRNLTKFSYFPLINALFNALIFNWLLIIFWGLKLAFDLQSGFMEFRLNILILNYRLKNRGKIFHRGKAAKFRQSKENFPWLSFPR